MDYPFSLQLRGWGKDFVQLLKFHFEINQLLNRQKISASSVLPRVSLLRFYCLKSEILQI